MSVFLSFFILTGFQCINMPQPNREKDNRISSHDHIIEKNNSMAKDNRCILEPHNKITNAQDHNSILSTSIYEETPEISKYEDPNNNSLPRIEMKNHEYMIQGINDMGEENIESNIRQFQEFLEDQILLNPKRRSGLLQTLPRFRAFDERKATNDNLDLENETVAFPMHSESAGSFLLKFLRAGDYNYEYAAKILFNYVRLMRDHPKYYATKLQPRLAQKVYDEKIHTVLPERDKFKRRVFIWRPGKWNPDTISFTDCYCAMYMLCEMMAIEPLTQIHGCTVVCDGSGIGLKQLKSMCLEDIRNSANFVQVNNCSIKISPKFPHDNFIDYI